jgi:hypothetical protein
MESMISLKKTEHTRLDIVPPVARDAGVIDDLSTTRGSVPGNTRQENTRLGGWPGDVYLAFFRLPARVCMVNGEDLGVNPTRKGKRQERSMDIGSSGCSLRCRQGLQQPRWFMVISRRILGVSLLLFETALATAAMAEGKRLPWQKDPGPIAGRWSVTCDKLAGMVVEFKVDGRKATGSVSKVGNGSVVGYTLGEEIIRLDADDYGDWVGRLHWRAVTPSDRWDPIRFVATSWGVDATMTTDPCFKNMSRAN